MGEAGCRGGTFQGPGRTQKREGRANAGRPPEEGGAGCLPAFWRARIFHGKRVKGALTARFEFEACFGNAEQAFCIQRGK